MKVQVGNGTEWWHVETHSHIFEVSEIIPFKNGFSSSNHVLNYKTEKKLHYTPRDTKFTKLLLILTFRLTFKLLHI